MLLRAIVLFRIGGLCQIAVVLAFDSGRYRSQSGIAALTLAIVVESTALIVGCRRAGRLPPRWAGADVVFCAAALVAGADLTHASDGQSWVFFVYPFTIIVCVGVGIAFRTGRGAACATGVLVASYTASAVFLHGDPWWNVLPNALSYLPNSGVAWLLARVIRGNGAELDISRAQAVAQAAELGRQRERVRHARLLHDRVLQTMETLSTGDWVTDIRVRRQIAGEAAWLRALVQGVPVEEPHELIPALHQVIGERSVAGPHVAFNTAGAEEDPLIAHVDPESVTALQDATREALANVAKHAGVDSAVVRVAVESGCVVVSVLDQGTGFDVHAAPQDRGLHRSIREPLASVGGRVVIDSERGAGTYVELVLPVRPRPEQPTDRI